MLEYRKKLRGALVAASVIGAALPIAALIAPATPAWAVPSGGPVIFDTMKPGLDGGQMQSSEYVGRAYGYLLEHSLFPWNNDVAVLGTAGGSDSGPCSAMTGDAAQVNGAQATYYDGAQDIDAFFHEVESGVLRPRMIHIVEAGGCADGSDASEEDVYAANAQRIADYVNGGGALFANGQSYEWLTRLLPDLTVTPYLNPNNNFGSSRTPAGFEAFPDPPPLNDFGSPEYQYFGGSFGNLREFTTGGAGATMLGSPAVSLFRVLQATATTPHRVGETALVETDVVDGTGAPRANVGVALTWRSGPNPTLSMHTTTDQFGHASFEYSSSVPGTDELWVNADFSPNVTQTDIVTVVWDGLPSNPQPVFVPPPPVAPVPPAPAAPSAPLVPASAGPRPAASPVLVPGFLGLHTVVNGQTVTVPSAAPRGPAVGVAATATGSGSWTTDAAGNVAVAGAAANHGSLAGMRLNAPVSAISATATEQGYLLVAGDGGVFAFGDAVYHGSLAAQRLNRPIIGITPTASGGGYYMVAADGGVFTVGDARFSGSMATHR
ncbi:MAG: Esterase [Acidimicrobiia bacterium]|nr:Esterase [Acidimicrobiia bacterium]